jgi:two-component system, cell cycle sensor histidine kinase and response regulator CckA
VGRPGTARTGSERRQAAPRRALDAALDEAPIGMAVVDADGRYLYVNRTLAAINGLPADEHIGRSFREVLTPEVADATEAVIARVIEHGEAVEDEVEWPDTSGRPRRWRRIIYPLRRDGRTAAVGALIRDVTTFHEAETARRQGEELLRIIYDSTYDPMVILDGEEVVDANRAWLDLIQYDRDEAIGRSILDLIAPEQRELARRRIAEGLTAPYEVHVLRRDGRRLTIQTRAQEVSYRGRRLRINVGHDVTAVRESEERFRLLLEGIGAIVWEADPETVRFSYVSPQVEDLLGYPRDDWLEDGFWADHLHPDDRERTVDECRCAIAACEDHELEYRMVASDGRAVWLRDSVRVALDQDGRPSLLRGVMVDMTERKSLEEQLQHAMKMEAIGRLAGGLAHDFNNLLTAVIAHAEHAAAETAEPAVRAEMDGVLAAAERGAALTRQLLAFGHRSKPSPEPVHPNQLLRAMEPMLRRLLRENVDLQLDLRPVGTVMIDPGQLEQVVMNLVVNAHEAMPDGGCLRISTGAVAEERAGTIAISDTGPGIDVGDRERIFEPYFTTKPAGESSGLGLATVYGIVSAAGGRVTVGDGEAGGALFEVRLPLAGDAAAPAPPDRTAPELAADARGTVLLVEDEAGVRAVVERMLESAGYAVVSAPGAREALAEAERLGEALDLLVTDVVMPEVGGPELAERLRATRPELPVLYMSGYAPGEREPGRDDARAGFLGKPFGSRELLDAADRVLNRTRRPV